MNTTVPARELMDRVAILMNDPDHTDYTYAVIQPYLNMAIEQLAESMEESNNTPSNRTSDPILIPLGTNQVTFIWDPTPGVPHFPDDLVEIQEIGERSPGSTDQFIRMDRKEFISAFPSNNSLLYWSWENNIIKFNPNGALGDREIQIRYVGSGLVYALDPSTNIIMPNCRQFLSFKAAAFCAMFIGENETRAKVLDDQAEAALERVTSISNKGRQQIATRHRPFRANYKMRGWG